MLTLADGRKHGHIARRRLWRALTVLIQSPYPSARQFGDSTMFRVLALTVVLTLSLQGFLRADEPSLKKFTPPAESTKDEPIAKQFSMEKAVSFLDNAALE